MQLVLQCSHPRESLGACSPSVVVLTPLLAIPCFPVYIPQRIMSSKMAFNIIQIRGCLLCVGAVTLVNRTAAHREPAV